MNFADTDRTNNDAPSKTKDLIQKIESMTKEELNQFIFLVSKELDLQLR